MGLYARNNPVDIAIAVWPWGAYLGEDALEQGVRCKISSFRRYGPNTLPPAAKASGQYINSVLAKHEASRGGYDEAILLNEQGYDRRRLGRERVRRARRRAAHAADQRLLPARHHPRQRDHGSPARSGYEVREVSLVRTDLYFADEVFLCGTAAEVTPVASVDDQPCGGRGPITKEHPAARLLRRGRTGATSGSARVPGVPGGRGRRFLALAW